MKLPVNYNDLTWQMRKLVREEYLHKQNGLCKYCNMPLNSEPSDKIKSMKINWNIFPNGFQKYPIHLHHNHKTGMTIGTVHMKCNAVMFQYEGE